MGRFNVTYSFLAVETAIDLYSEALSLEPDSPSHALNLVHVIELLPDYDRVMNTIKE